MKVHWTDTAEGLLDEIREVIEGPYRMIYQIKPEQVGVLAAIQGATDILRSRDLEAD
jgi:hypothetical protein